jgi:hypothetical protein
MGETKLDFPVSSISAQVRLGSDSEGMQSMGTRTFCFGRRFILLRACKLEAQNLDRGLVLSVRISQSVAGCQLRHYRLDKPTPFIT